MEEGRGGGKWEVRKGNGRGEGVEGVAGGVKEEKEKETNNGMLDHVTHQMEGSNSSNSPLFFPSPPSPFLSTLSKYIASASLSRALT